MNAKKQTVSSQVDEIEKILILCSAHNVERLTINSNGMHLSFAFKAISQSRLNESVENAPVESPAGTNFTFDTDPVESTSSLMRRPETLDDYGIIGQNS